MKYNNIEFVLTPYDGYYASLDGDILSTRHSNPRILHGAHDKNGYIKMQLGEYYVRRARVIAETFIPNPTNKPTVNHKNGIRDDDRVANLEWCTYGENNLHRYRILGYISQNRKHFDVYENNQLIQSDRCVKDLITQYGYSHAYKIINNLQEWRACYCEKENAIIRIWWNGQIIDEGSVNDISIRWNVRKHSVYRRAKKCRETGLCSHMRHIHIVDRSVETNPEKSEEA